MNLRRVARVCMEARRAEMDGVGVRFEDATDAEIDCMVEDVARCVDGKLVRGPSSDLTTAIVGVFMQREAPPAAAEPAPKQEPKLKQKLVDRLSRSKKK